jgi:hypothetical protein
MSGWNITNLMIAAQVALNSLIFEGTSCEGIVVARVASKRWDACMARQTMLYIQFMYLVCVLWRFRQLESFNEKSFIMIEQRLFSQGDI